MSLVRNQARAFADRPVRPAHLEGRRHPCVRIARDRRLVREERLAIATCTCAHVRRRYAPHQPTEARVRRSQDRAGTAGDRLSRASRFSLGRRGRFDSPRLGHRALDHGYAGNRVDACRSERARRNAVRGHRSTRRVGCHGRPSSRGPDAGATRRRFSPSSRADTSPCVERLSRKASRSCAREVIGPCACQEPSAGGVDENGTLEGSRHDSTTAHSREGTSAAIDYTRHTRSEDDRAIALRGALGYFRRAQLGRRSVGPDASVADHRGHRPEHAGAAW